MRVLPAALGLLLVAGQALADAPETRRQGYAFDSPRVLAEQRLFGIAHGVSLLASACREVPDSAARVESAYSAWRAEQQVTIDLAAAALARYHFGSGAAAADWPAIASALNLKERLELAPDAEELRAACASLPEALAQPRYALGERMRLEELMAQVVAALEVEAHGAWCGKRVPEAAREVHAARYENWREINLPVLKQAQQALAAAWPQDAPAPSFDEWRAEQQRALRIQGSVAQCLEYSETLKQPQAALRNVFNQPPAGEARP